MKEFTLDIPTIAFGTNEMIIEDVKGFAIKQVTITTTSEGSKVTIKYDEAPVITNTVFAVGGIRLSSDMTEEEVEKHVKSALRWEGLR